MSGADDEAITGGNGHEGDIFEGDFEQDGGIDPMESLSIFRRPQFQLQGVNLTEEDEEDEEEDTVEDLLKRWSAGYGGEGGGEDSVKDYVHGLPGTTPPRVSTSRSKKKDKHKLGKSLSQEARVIVARKNKQEPSGRPVSMVDFPLTVEGTNSDSPSSRRHRSRRHTIPDVRTELCHLSKKDRRSLQRALSPQLSSEDGAARTPKASKKLKKVQRGKDRDDKSGLLQAAPGSPRPPLMPEMSRTASVGADITGGNDYLDFIGNQSVADSLNPSAMQRKGSSNLERRREMLRRTNSELYTSLGGGSNERRCPPERKQFYRQFIKSIKFFGISSTTANRMEVPTPSHMPRFHSENLAMSNPYGPKMERLWLELQAYLRDRSPDAYEEWTFFNQTNVDRVLKKILHYSCTDVDATQSLTSLRLPARAGYEPLHGSYSTPSFGILKKPGTIRGDLQEALGAVTRKETGQPEPAEMCSVNGGDMATPANRFFLPGGGLQWCMIREPVRQCEVSQCTTTQGSNRVQGPDQDQGPPESNSCCKVGYQDFLLPLQQRALMEVDRLLCELDEVECLCMNRKRMGDDHPTYRTKFFKRRVCALNLYHKVTYGLADNLCQLSEWLGVPILLPDICMESPVESPEINRRADPCGTYLQPPLSPLSPARLRVTAGSEGSAPPQSPLATSLRPQFLVGSPDDSSDFFTRSGSETPLDVSMPKVFAGDARSTLSSESAAKLHRLKSQESRQDPYREFVSRSLKRKGIAFLVTRLKEFIASNVRLAKYTLTVQQDNKDADLYEEFSEDERKPLLPNAHRFMAPSLLEAHAELPPHLFSRSVSLEPQNWNEEFHAMNLPSFATQYIQLVHVPLDVMRECLRLQVELDKDLVSPTPHTVKQLADECREILKHAVDVRDAYREDIKAVLSSNHSKADRVESDLEGFENDMRNVLKVYFRYLKTWVNFSSGHILEEEWRNVKKICTSIRGGEAEAGRKFCDMVTELLESMGDDLDQKMDDCCTMIINERTTMEAKELLSQSSRHFKEMFTGIRERVNRVLGFAKILRKDLEIAADFKIMTTIPELFNILKASDHVRVVLPHQKVDKMIFVPEGTSENTDEIQQLLNVSFAHGSPEDHHFLPKEAYILLLNVNVTESQSAWSGKTVAIEASAETTINLSELQVDSLKMVVANSSQLNESRSSFLNAVGKAVLLTSERTSSHENVAERINDLKVAACELAKRLMKTANKVMDYLSIDDIAEADDSSSSLYQSAMHACFNLGFEYVREVFRLLGDDLAYQELGAQALDYALVWIRFVLDKSERGRGTRPRWATTGLEFMIVACAPTTLAAISHSRFESVKKLMNRCVDHVVGEAPPTTSIIQKDNSMSRLGMHNKKPWVKPRKLPFGAMGYSFPASTHSEFEEEDTSVYKLPQTKFPTNGACLKVEEPPLVAIYDPSRMETAAHLYTGGPTGVEGIDYECSGAGAGLYQRQQSPLSTIASQSLPNSTDSLEHSSGVDSPLDQSTSDLSSSTANYPSIYPSPHIPTSLTSAHSPDTSYQQLLPQTTPPPVHNGPVTDDAPPQQRYALYPATPTSVERMDSATSTGSVSRYYSTYQRTPSGGTPNSLSRSDSGSSCEGPERTRRIQDEIRLFEINREERLRKKKQIGHVSKVRPSARRNVANLTDLRQTNFKWQKGRKLGEGRFGKVYECLNLTTGEINAVKQISIQEKDTSAIQTIIDEISNFQRLRNDYVVKFYGVEIHHNELYMFMEYCNEGTLWTIAQQGLTEDMIRHYTRDILKAVDKMHTSGIVHRDIKGANIFLSSNGSIKLGDFGLSVQLKNYNMTQPNEIKQQAGTVPYMAPEVILQRDMGRPMDIWSVGCVLIEMATGKLPWAEYDNQWTIMLQLGSGKAPSVQPKSALSKEGHQFLGKCFTVDVQKRPTALDLLSDPFVRVSD